MIEIRRATVEDIEAIADFQVNMALETEQLTLDRNTLRKGVKSLLEDEQKGHYYLAWTEAVPVGSLMITFEWSDWRNGNVWWIQSVYIDSKYRGRGLFRKMYDAIKEEVIDKPEVCGIRLYVFKDNEHAKAVYEKLGMSGDHYEVYEWMK